MPEQLSIIESLFEVEFEIEKLKKGIYLIENSLTSKMMMEKLEGLLSMPNAVQIANTEEIEGLRGIIQKMSIRLDFKKNRLLDLEKTLEKQIG